MKKIKEFKNRRDLEEYFLANSIEKIGEGSEGKVFLTKSKEIIKNMADAWVPKKYESYPNIIMDEDLKLNSYIFPKELFILDGIIVGYRQDYFPNNILYSAKKISKIDINKLVKARNKFIEDTKILTDNGYQLFELYANLLFDNEQFVAIDTLDYKKVNDITLNENIKIMDHAILYNLKYAYPFIETSEPFDSEIEKVYSKKLNK